MAGPAPVASASNRCPTIRPIVCIPFSRPISPPAPPPRPTAGPGIPVLPASPTIHMSSAAWPPMSCCPGPTTLCQSQALGARRLSRPTSQTPPDLPRRVRLPLQPAPHPTCRFPLAPQHRRGAFTPQLQNVDPTGSKGISDYPYIPQARPERRRMYLSAQGLVLRQLICWMEIPLEFGCLPFLEDH